jgi:hypothetical protein
LALQAIIYELTTPVIGSLVTALMIIPKTATIAAAKTTLFGIRFKTSGLANIEAATVKIISQTCLLASNAFPSVIFITTFCFFYDKYDLFMYL